MTEPPDLDARRTRAHAKAVTAIVAGVTVRALHAAGVILVALVAGARLTSFIAGHGFRDSPVWAAGPVGVAAAVAAVSALTAWFFARAALRGAGEWLLDGLPVTKPSDGGPLVVRNVVEALSIGRGIEPPEIRVIDDPAPNAISARSGGRAILCITTGLAELPRDEVEAVCAHELTQATSPDARLFGAGFMALVRAEHGCVLVGSLGVLLVLGTLWAATDLQVLLPSVLVIGVLLAVVSVVAAVVLGVLLQSLRRAIDDVADVAAVHLARNPAALAAVLDRLSKDHRRVTVTTDRAEWLWFEAVEKAVAASAHPGAKVTAKAAAALTRIEDDLSRRAELARATAAGLA